VFASAGSGKTKSLVDRYVKSLFFGIKPREILCLTFTNAAVFEMESRISEILQSLYLNSDGFTESYLRSVIGLDRAQPEDIERASRLFFKFQDELKDVRIMTVHSFCQDILKKFPIEAGLSPDFDIIDEHDSSELMELAKNNVLEKIDELGGEDAVLSLSRIISGHSFEDLVCRISSDSLNFTKFFEKYDDLDAYRKALESFLGKTEELSFTEEQRSIISEIFVDASPEEVFLTKSGDIRKKYKDDEIAQIVFANLNNKKISAIVEKTINFLKMAKIILNEYARLKSEDEVIDFADVLYLTESLLQKGSAKEFILSNVCQGIRSVMIDEAQDLSKIQWKIISLCSDDITSDPQSDKTIFIVGDEKQSIYRFHGADYRLFLNYHKYLEVLSCASCKKFKTIHMSTNFRSLGGILDGVDGVFDGLFKGYKRHTAHRGAGGSIELIEIEDCEDQPAVVAEFIKSLKLPPSDMLILTRSRTEFSNCLMRSLSDRGIKIAPPDKTLLSDNLLIMDTVALAEICIAANDYKLACILKSPHVFESPLSNDDLFHLCNSGDGVLNSLRSMHFDKWKLIDDVINSYASHNLVEFFYRLVTLVIRKFTPEDEYIISSFMDEVLRFSQKKSACIAEFVECFKKSNVYISQQNALSEGVRLSTIHGAKGLESPVVFLLDFELSPDKSKTKFVWVDEMNAYNRGRGDYFFVKPSQAESTHSVNQILDSEYERESEELLRLLYVAMTRSRDRLVIFGNEKTNGAYRLIKKRMALTDS
jgi:ATP-dependent helicase/nuclease subunit A